MISQLHRLPRAIRARRLSTGPFSRRKGSTSAFSCWSTFKRPVLGLLGWNSYGTEGAQPVANVRAAQGAKEGLISDKPLPPAATGCRLDRMVRRGSPVRVRKRASRKSCTAAFSAARPFAYVPQRSVVEHFLEHPGFWAAGFVAWVGNGRLVLHLDRQASLNQKAHNPEVAGSNPAPATEKALETGPFCCRSGGSNWKLLPNFCPRAVKAEAIGQKWSLSTVRLCAEARPLPSDIRRQRG